MASVRQDKRTGRYYVMFRFGGRQYQRAITASKRRAALAAVARVEETIGLIERSRLVVPDDVDPAEFILSDGRLTSAKPKVTHTRLKELTDSYLASIPTAAKEESTIQGERIHIEHLHRHLGKKTFVSTIKQSTLQDYIATRTRDRYRDRNISAETVRKEITTLRLIWNWGRQNGLLGIDCPTRGLQYPKSDEKPPFLTWEEVEHRIARGGLTEAEERELWECLFLTTTEIDELLSDVEKRLLPAFVYPMFLFAAHTGARRSEILRSRIEDFDFELRTVHIREKKRSRKRAMTFRRVPMSAKLCQEMRVWLSQHPGGQFLISRQAEKGEGRAVTTNVATQQFKHALKGTKWGGRVRGFHVLRHSFASNAAAAGVDVGMIDAWMGHQTEEMRNRYRHLFPKRQQSAIDRVFPNQKRAKAG